MSAATTGGKRVAFAGEAAPNDTPAPWERGLATAFDDDEAALAQAQQATGAGSTVLTSFDDRLSSTHGSDSGSMRGSSASRRILTDPTQDVSYRRAMTDVLDEAQKIEHR